MKNSTGFVKLWHMHGEYNFHCAHIGPWPHEVYDMIHKHLSETYCLHLWGSQKLCYAMTFKNTAWTLMSNTFAKFQHSWYRNTVFWKEHTCRYEKSDLTNIKFRYGVIVVHFILLRVAFVWSHSYACFKMLMAEPLFDVLRTKEQLGYQVYNIVRDTFGILGFSVTVTCRAGKYRYINRYLKYKSYSCHIYIYVHCCSVLYTLLYQIMMKTLTALIYQCWGRV